MERAESQQEACPSQRPPPATPLRTQCAHASSSTQPSSLPSQGEVGVEVPEFRRGLAAQPTTRLSLESHSRIQCSGRHQVRIQNLLLLPGGSAWCSGVGGGC